MAVTGFDLLPADGHILFELDGRRVLVDSGSPATVASIDVWEFLGERYAPLPEYMGSTVESFSELAGFPIDVLIGADLLGRLRTRIDLPRRRIRFGDECETADRVRMGLASLLGVPVSAAYVGEHRLNAVIDTGAKLSYLDGRLLDGLTRVDEADDFHPLAGRFRTPVYDVPVAVAEVPFRLRCGVLPASIAGLLHGFDIAAIIGTGFLEWFDTCLDLPASTLWFRPHAERAI